MGHYAAIDRIYHIILREGAGKSGPLLSIYEKYQKILVLERKSRQKYQTTGTSEIKN